MGNNINGIIYRCSASGRAEGGEGVGGLVGSNDEGWLNESFATGPVSGNFNVGGMMGNLWIGRELLCDRKRAWSTTR